MDDFDKMLQQANAMKTSQDEAAAVFDERYVMFKKNCNYEFRLCWPSDPSGTRMFPFIFRWAHVDFGEGKETLDITCPTSDYILGKSGFKQCPICDEVSAFYDDSEKTGSKTSKELYDHFKRKARNTALVYVISDGNDPKNNGTFKLIYVVPQVADFLRRKIYGWAIKKGEEPLPLNRQIGKSAFLCDAGYNLAINVTHDGKYNQYAPEFLPQPTSVPITQADVNKAGIDLKFDSLMLTSTLAERQNFIKTRILQVKMDIELKGSGASAADVMASINPNNAVNQTTTTTQTATGAQPASTPAVQQTPAGNAASSVDDIIAGLNLEG